MLFSRHINERQALASLPGSGTKVPRGLKSALQASQHGKRISVRDLLKPLAGLMLEPKPQQGLACDATSVRPGHGGLN